MLSKTSQYAIRAVVALAAIRDPHTKTGVAELAEQLGVPKHFLAKVLQQLVKSGIVSSAKGPKGGFYLTADNRHRRLADIVILFEGDKFFNGCILGLEYCSATHPCPLHTQFAAYREGINYHLKEHSVESFAKRMRETGDSLII